MCICGCLHGLISKGCVCFLVFFKELVIILFFFLFFTHEHLGADIFSTKLLMFLLHQLFSLQLCVLCCQRFRAEQLMPTLSFSGQCEAHAHFLAYWALGPKIQLAFFKCLKQQCSRKHLNIYLCQLFAGCVFTKYYGQHY